MPIELTHEQLLERLERISLADKEEIENLIIASSTKVKNAAKVPPERMGQWDSWEGLAQELLSRLLEERRSDAQIQVSDCQTSEMRTDQDFFNALEQMETLRWNTPENTMRDLIRWATAKLRDRVPLPADQEIKYQEWKWVLLEIFRNLVYDRT